jgi:hypothetical protein
MMGLRVYVDPRDVEDGLPKADIICLGMADPSQVPERDVLRLAEPQTIVMGLPPCIARFRLNQLPIQAGGRHEVLGLIVEAADAGGGDLGYSFRCPS